MQGEGIRASFEVTESGNKPSVDADFQKLLDNGSQQYAAYVKDQTEQLIVGTKTFAEAFAAGDAAKPVSFTPPPACTGSGSNP